MISSQRTALSRRGCDKYRVRYHPRRSPCRRRQHPLGTGRARPSPVKGVAAVCSDHNVERWDQLKDGYNQYLLTDPRTSGGIPNLWGSVPVVESEACPAGTALLGDFRKAVLFDREDVQVSVGTADQDFIRNIVRLLAETRLGFAVTRPAAFVEVDLVA